MKGSNWDLASSTNKGIIIRWLLIRARDQQDIITKKYFHWEQDISNFDEVFTPNNPSSIVLVTTTGLPLRFSDEIFISTMKVRTRDSRLN